MPPPDLIRAFLSQASSTGSRSTALQPLVWLCGILTSGLVIAISRTAPEWALITLALFLGVTICVYLGIYIYFALRNTDALRSEKYTLSKMAIEKNLIGDDKAGLLEVGDFENTPSTSALPNKKERAE